MKNFKKIFFAVAAFVAGLLTACGPKETYEPGPVCDGPQVYFPSDMATTFSVDDDQSVVTIPLYRINTQGTLTVDFIHDFGTMTDPEQALFEGISTSVTFADGQNRVDVEIPFNRPKLQEGTEYKIGFLITDESLRTPYGLSSIYVTITPWPWAYLGEGTYKDGYLVGMFPKGNTAPVKVKVHEHKSKKGVYMFEELFGWDFLTSFFGMPRGAIETQVAKYNPTNIIVDCTNPEKVTIAKQQTGIVDIDPSYGAYFIYSEKELSGTFDKGVITFPAKGLGLGCVKGVMPTNENGDFTLLLPGAQLLDYSLAGEYAGMNVEADNTTTNAVLNFTYGADVSNISYVIASGDVTHLTAGVVQGMISGQYPPSTIENFVPGQGEVSVMVNDLKAKGYTVVAVPNALDGSMVADEAISFYFYFPGLSGSDIPECTGTLELYNVSKFPNIKPEIVEKNPDYSSMAYLLTSKDILKAKYWINTTPVYESIEQQGLTVEGVVEQYGVELSSKAITALNEKGSISSVFSGLDQNTSYTMVFLLQSKYGKKAVVVSNPATTTKLPYHGELVIGDYSMTCQPADFNKPFTNQFKLLPTADSNTHFHVESLAIPDGTKWHADYDAKAGTLTLNGHQVGEDAKNYFGGVYGYFNAEQTQAYGVYAFHNSKEDPTGPAVFKVDPTTKQLSALNTDLVVPVFDMASQQLVGVAGQFDKGTAVKLDKSNMQSVRPFSTGLKGFMPFTLYYSCGVAESLPGVEVPFEVLNVEAHVCEPLATDVNTRMQKTDLF